MKGFLLFLVLGLFETTWSQYEANWDSIDSRPLPVWYDQAKVGIFLHWGVYSVPAYGDAWFWNSWKTSGPDSIFAHFMQNNYYPGFTYQDFGPQFTAEFFDPAQWADLFARAGAKYVVLTSKHHEGYTLWPSKYSFGWNAKDVGPNRDLVGDLATAVKNRGLAFGLYHSLYEWYNPVYMSDKANSWATQDFVDNKVIPEMKEIITAYQPEVLWSDGEWEAPDTYWKSTEFLAWLYNESPVKETVVTNDRWGAETSCTHGGFMTCADRYNPGYLLPYKWENAMTIDNHGAWAYRRDLNIEDVLTPHELVEALISTVATGGNILINVGPTKEGTIIPIFQERLTQLGSWLDLNGEAIYESTPWVDHQNDTITPGVWYTSKGDAIYAIFLNWPTDGVLVLGAVTSLFGGTVSPGVVILGNEDINVQFTATVDDVRFTLPSFRLTSEWAWILKIAPQA